MPTDAPRARALRRLPPGRLLGLLALFVAIFFVARGCQSTGIDLTQDEAIEIAKTQVEFVPDNPQVRLLRRGVSFRPQWVVSLSEEAPDGRRINVTVVTIDAETGEILRVQRS